MAGSHTQEGGHSEVLWADQVGDYVCLPASNEVLDTLDGPGEEGGGGREGGREGGRREGGRFE